MPDSAWNHRYVACMDTAFWNILLFSMEDFVGAVRANCPPPLSLSLFKIKQEARRKSLSLSNFFAQIVCSGCFEGCSLFLERFFFLENSLLSCWKSHDSGKDSAYIPGGVFEILVREGGIGKGVFAKNCPKQTRDKFATILRTLPLMHETKYWRYCKTLVCNLWQICATPPRKCPLLGISEYYGLGPRERQRRVQNVLFSQGGANRTANSPPKGPKAEEIVIKGGHLKWWRAKIFAPPMEFSSRSIQPNFLLSFLSPGSASRMTFVQGPFGGFQLIEPWAHKPLAGFCPGRDYTPLPPPPFP